MADNPVFNQALFDGMMGLQNLETRSREEYIRAPFGWPGGKWHSLDYLNRYLPVRDTWVDVCGGSGIVTLNRPKSKLEIFNDRHSGVTAFYRCVQNPIKWRLLVDRLRYILHSREEFIWCRETWQEKGHEDVERAARWYYSVRFSFSQIGRNFARATNGAPVQGRAFRNGLKGFQTIHDRFSDVIIENLDCCQCLRDFDQDGAVFYVDPDYIDTDDGLYHHGVDHRTLIEVVRDMKGFVAVSGYANALYDAQSFWDDRKSWPVVVSSKAQTDLVEQDRSVKAEEVLWIKESK